MAQVKLIGSKDSLFCARIECALKLKGIEYEYLEEDLNNKSPILLKYNPIHKKVPVLLHNGKAIAESLVILEYLDDVWKENPLLPSEPYQRAMARFWAKYIDEKVVLRSYETCLKGDREEMEKLIESTNELLALLEKEIAGNKFFAGESVGYLDVVMSWAPFRLKVMEQVAKVKLLEAEKFPSLHQWSKNFMNIPLIQEGLPTIEFIFASFGESVKYFHSFEANNP